MATFIIGTILLGWVLFVCWRWYQKRKTGDGCGECGCGCQGCPKAVPGNIYPQHPD